MSQGRQRQTDALRKAAVEKAKRSRKAAENGLRKVLKSGDPVTFAAVARAAGVTPHYLRRQPDLAERITHLRDAQTSRTTVPTPRQAEGEPTVIAVLRHRLRTEQEHHQTVVTELRRQNQELEDKLAAAHAEIHRLRETYERSPEHLQR